MFKSRVSSKDGIIRLDDRARELRSWINAELKFRFLAVVSRKPLEKQSTETRASSTSERVENEEALETRAVVCKPPELIHDGVNELFADGVVTTRIFGNQDMRG